MLDLFYHLVCIASINRVNVFCYDMHNLIDVN